MPRKKTKPTQVIIGLDIGYGYTKLVASVDGRAEEIVFPSVCGHAVEIKFRAEEVATRYPGDQLTDDDGDWFIGNLALSQLRPAQQIRLRGRTANEAALGNSYRVRLMKAALGKLLPGLTNGDAVHVQIATGLPVDHMRDAGDLKAALIGQHYIHTDTTHFVANVTDVSVMPQPYGTIYTNMIQDNGQLDECYAYSRTGIVDIGQFTVDVTLDDDGEYIDTRSGSNEGGVFTVFENLATAYERDFRSKPNPRDIETIIHGDGCLKVRGEEVNYTRERAEAIRPLVDITLSLLNDKWGPGNDVDVIFLTGGGAALVLDAVRDVYPQTQIEDSAQTANARGYLHYLLYQFFTE